MNSSSLAALVGTFLGVLLPYGFVAPVSSALEGRAREQSQFLGCLKTGILATVQGNSPQIAVEFGRKVIPHSSRPTFSELEDHVKGTWPVAEDKQPIVIRRVCKKAGRHAARRRLEHSGP